MIKLLLPVLFLTGCVAISPNIEKLEDENTDSVYYSFELGVSYPKKKFMTQEEWLEYHESPDSLKDVLYATYKEREKAEQNLDRFIEKCILRFTLDC